MKRALLLFIFFLKAYSGFSQCDSFLSIPTNAYYNRGVTTGVKIGDLDISGNQLTVEAVFNGTSLPAYFFNEETNGNDLVSKHNRSTDCNYLLRTHWAAITTSNGFFTVTPRCWPQRNKTYHVAMVYNGSSLKYYTNGYLVGETPASGNLVINDIPAKIGHEVLNGELDQFPVGFVGYINNVRIWNVARTQAQLQAFMYGHLPNPTTQTGLKAYYTFSSLVNKQGNTAYNAVLYGKDISLNALNPTCATYTADSCAPANRACGGYLNVQQPRSGVAIGDLDITGNQITVEALCYRSTPYTAQYRGGDVVSKHSSTTDNNYLLRPNCAEITTTNGFYSAVSTQCDAPVGALMHVALVYDGSSLKFYRNGQLMSQVAASGNLITNDWPTRIGTEALLQSADVHFIGYINEVRIWNVARTQQQLTAYMETTLPNPTLQPGLKAYYNFSSLVNRQGNSAYNGSIFGTAVTGQSTPECNVEDLGYFGGCYILSRMAGPSQNKMTESITDPIKTAAENKVSIYPNPGREQVNINIHADKTQAATLSLLSISGQLMMMQRTTLLKGKNTIRLENSAELKPGVYLVKILVDNQAISRKLVIE